jgi:hypothetical protein
MNTLSKLTTFFIFLSFLFSNAQAQNSYRPSNTGFISFNFGATSLTPRKYQKLSLFGCNTSITDSILTQVPYNRSWRKPNQVIPGIPFGWQVDTLTKDSFYVSKYYLASPPIMEQITNDTIYNIGIVTPDEFDLIGDKPAQSVYMDYSVLKITYIEYLPVEFDNTFYNSKDSIVPFQVECKDFPWLDSNGIHGAKGASGIGYLTNTSKHTGRLFLPYYYEKGPQSGDSVKVYLDCQVTILNDILFRHEVFFKIDNVFYTSINLKDYKDKKQAIQFSLRPRKDLPCGCKEPERAKEGLKPKKTGK